jgi:hypothetical protein
MEEKFKKFIKENQYIYSNEYEYIRLFTLYKNKKIHLNHCHYFTIYGVLCKQYKIKNQIYCQRHLNHINKNFKELKSYDHYKKIIQNISPKIN